MASGRIQGITIEISGDTVKLQDSLKEVDKSLRDTQSKLITGITITQNNEITVPNRRLKKTSNSIARALSPSATKTEKTSALGKINSVQQVNSNLFMNPSKQLSSK